MSSASPRSKNGSTEFIWISGAMFPSAAIRAVLHGCFPDSGRETLLPQLKAGHSMFPRRL